MIDNNISGGPDSNNNSKNETSNRPTDKNEIYAPWAPSWRQETVFDILSMSWIVFLCSVFKGLYIDGSFNWSFPIVWFLAACMTYKARSISDRWISVLVLFIAYVIIIVTFLDAVTEGRPSVAIIGAPVIANCIIAHLVSVRAGLFYVLVSVCSKIVLYIMFYHEIFDADYDNTEVNIGFTNVVTSGSAMDFMGFACSLALTRNFNEILDQLRSSRNEAHAQSKAKELFVANTSHELRTPLNAILNFVELVLYSKQSTLGEQDRAQLSMTLDCSRLLLSIINDLLDVAKLNANKVTLQNVSFDVEAVLRSLPLIFEAQANKRDITIEVDLRLPKLPKFIMGDPLRLRQILLNLFSNAIKFCNDGGCVALIAEYIEVDDARTRLASSSSTSSLSYQFNQAAHHHQNRTNEDPDSSTQAQEDVISPSLTRSNQSHSNLVSLAQKQAKLTPMLAVTVTDTGLGISEADMAGIFRPFTQCRPAGLHGGTGLGLSICKQLVELFGGRIGVTSVPHACTSFTFTIPIREATEMELNDRNVDELKSLSLPCSAYNHHSAWDEDEDIHKQASENKHSYFPNNTTENTVMMGTLLGSSGVYSDSQDHLPELLDAVDSNSPTFNLKIPSLVPLATALPGTDASCLPQDVTVSKPKADSTANDSSGPVNILVVDDNKINCKVAAAVLQRLGYHHNQLELSGQAALSALEAKRFDVVLMDVHMNDMDGLTATRVIREQEKSTSSPRQYVIGVTASASTHDRQSCLDAGMDDFLSKPLRRNELEKALLKFYKSSSKYNHSHQNSISQNHLVEDQEVGMEPQNCPGKSL